MQHLLLLHGAIGSKAQLQPLADLIESDFHIHLLNLSGHGGNAFADDFSIEQFASEILDYLDQNQLEKINIFGYSMGGYVALHLAKNHPNRVGKIFTLATKFEWSPEIAAREIKMLDADKMEQKIPAFADVLKQRHEPNDWKELLSKTSKMMIGMGGKNPLQLEDLKLMENPVRIAIGDQDQMVSLEETIAVYRNLPNATLTVFAHTQHPIEKVNAQKLASEMRDFFIPTES